MTRPGHVPPPPVRFPTRAAAPHVQAAVAQAKVASPPARRAPEVRAASIKPAPAAHVQRALATVQAKAAPQSPGTPRSAPRPGAVQAMPRTAPPQRGCVPRHPSVVQRARLGRPLAEPEPEKLEYDESSMSTFATMNVYRIGGNGVEADQPTIERYFTSGGGRHAEEKAIEHLQAKVNDGTLTHHNGGMRPDWKVVLFLSKSPCSSTSVPATRTDGNPGCLEKLTDLYTNGLTNTAGQTVIFLVNLAATKPYQPPITGAKDASRDNYDSFGGGGLTFDFVR